MSTSKYLLNKFVLVILVCFAFLAFTFFTDPNTVFLPFLIVPFLLIGLVIYLLVLSFMGISNRFRNSIALKLGALSVSVVTVGILLLKSLNQLTLRDGVMAGIFVILFWLYIRRADFLHK